MTSGWALSASPRLWASCVPRGASLIVMRHGQSAWTDPAINKFAGWADVPLTERGREQAANAGRLIAESGLAPTRCFTSVLGRAIETADIVIATAGLASVEVQRTWRLNERHYGSFQGRTRPEVRQEVGEELFATYRRSYDVRPPACDDAELAQQAADVRYRVDDGYGLPLPAEIRSESLKDLRARLAAWWADNVEAALKAGEGVLVVTHGSVVRAIMMSIDHISPADISGVNVPTGVPRAWDVTLGEDGTLEYSHGRYLDEDAANKGIEEVHQLGR